jgi:hypothetical protein
MDRFAIPCGLDADIDKELKGCDAISSDCTGSAREPLINSFCIIVSGSQSQAALISHGSPPLNDHSSGVVIVMMTITSWGRMPGASASNATRRL